MNGIMLLLGYIGVAITAIATLKGVGQLIRNSTGTNPQLPVNPTTFQTVFRLAKHLSKSEPVVLLLFLVTSCGLIAEYFGGWVGPAGSFLEVINLLCVVNFWIHFRTTDLTSDSA